VTDRICLDNHQVPFDVPVVAHDMLSRFIGTDYFSAAGASAKVPSRIGNEQEAIIGETHLNGSALDATTQKQAAEVDSAATKPENPITDAYYNIGAALLVLFILLLIGGGFLWRQRRRRGNRYGSFSAGSKGVGLPTTMSDGLNGQHRRNRSSASDYRKMAGDTEEANELLPLEHRQEGHSKSRSKASLAGSSLELPKGEELFSVGEEDEFDSDEEGNIGKAGRKDSTVSTNDEFSKERYDS
jgi:carboxypeptidase D